MSRRKREVIVTAQMSIFDWLVKLDRERRFSEVCSMDKKDAYAKYKNHFYRAKRLGIPFRFSFEEWCQWWMIDDRWYNRGNKEHQFVMARIDDVGAYCWDNVVCVTAGENYQMMRDGSKAALVKVKAEEDLIRALEPQIGSAVVSDLLAEFRARGVVIQASNNVRRSREVRASLLQRMREVSFSDELFTLDEVKERFADRDVLYVRYSEWRPGGHSCVKVVDRFRLRKQGKNVGLHSFFGHSVDVDGRSSGSYSIGYAHDRRWRVCDQDLMHFLLSELKKL